MNTRHYYYLLHCSLSWQSLHRLNICSLSAPSQMYFYFCKLLPIKFLLIFLVILGLFILNTWLILALVTLLSLQVSLSILSELATQLCNAEYIFLTFSIPPHFLLLDGLEFNPLLRHQFKKVLLFSQTCPTQVSLGWRILGIYKILSIFNMHSLLPSSLRFFSVLYFVQC